MTLNVCKIVAQNIKYPQLEKGKSVPTFKNAHWPKPSMGWKGHFGTNQSCVFKTIMYDRAVLIKANRKHHMILFNTVLPVWPAFRWGNLNVRFELFQIDCCRCFSSCQTGRYNLHRDCIVFVKTDINQVWWQLCAVLFSGRAFCIKALLYHHWILTVIQSEILLVSPFSFVPGSL